MDDAVSPGWRQPGFAFSGPRCPPRPRRRGRRTKRRPGRFRLTAAERSRAAELTERHETFQRLKTASPIYLVATELIRDKNAENARLALVTHFRYEGGLAIETLVDVGEGKVLKVETRENAHTPLAKEELVEAIRLTLADRDVRAALGRDIDQVQVEGLHLLTPDPADPIYGHRAVRMLFRVGKLYRSAPVVVVDLNTRRVVIENPPPAAGHGH